MRELMLRPVAKYARRPELVVALAIAMLPFDGFKVGPGGLISLPNVGFVLACAVFLWSSWRDRLRERWRQLVVPGLFLLGFAIASLSTAGGSALRFLASLVAMAVILGLVQLVATRPRTTWPIAAALVAAAFVAAAAALGQYGLSLAGLVPVDEIHLCNINVTFVRAYGLPQSTNYLGFFLVPGAIVATALLTTRRTLVLIAVTATIVLALLLTLSRSAIASFAIAEAVGIVLLVASRARMRFAVATAAACGFALVVLASLLFGTQSASFAIRVNTIIDGTRAFLSDPLHASGGRGAVESTLTAEAFCGDPSLVPIPVVTSLSTSAPTTRATTRPTTAVTFVPGVGPTVVQTSVPTTEPTAVPTTVSVRQTLVPTSAPTTVATTVPIVIPGAAPTTAPTTVPTSRPTFVATSVVVSGSPTPDSARGRVALATHDTLLEAAIVGGVFGLASYLLLVGATVAVAIKRRRPASLIDRRLQDGLVLAALAVFLTSFFIDALVIKQFYVVVGLLWASSLWDRDEIQSA